METKSSLMRIAYIIGKLKAGGVESVVFNYYRAINHEKYQFDFYYDADSTVAPPQDLIEMGARFFMLPPYQHLPAYIKELRSYLKREKYVIVHSHLNTLSVFPLYAAWREHVPVRIAHNHSVPAGDEFARNLLKYILRTFSKLFSTDWFACSEKAGRWMFGDKSFEQGKVYVLSNAIDFKRFENINEKTREIETKLGLTDKFTVGHVGRFTYAKNHLFLLDIFEKILEYRNDAVLVLVGDGEDREKIENAVTEKRLQEHVILAGSTSTPEIYYKLFNVVIFPSVFEGFGLAAIESQIAGVPVVTSDAVPEDAVISDGCCRLRLSDAPEKWAETALKLSGKILHYNDRAPDFDISKKAAELEAWYDNAVVRYSRVK